MLGGHICVSSGGVLLLPHLEELDLYNTPCISAAAAVAKQAGKASVAHVSAISAHHACRIFDDALRVGGSCR
jgi:hypothetical protein